MSKINNSMIKRILLSASTLAVISSPFAAGQPPSGANCIEPSSTEGPDEEYFARVCKERPADAYGLDDRAYSYNGLYSDTDNAWCALDICYNWVSPSHQACGIIEHDDIAACFAFPTWPSESLEAQALMLYAGEDDSVGFGKYISDDNVQAFIDAWKLGQHIQTDSDRWKSMHPTVGTSKTCQSWLQRHRVDFNQNRVVPNNATHFIFDGYDKCYFYDADGLPEVSGECPGCVAGPRFCNGCAEETVDATSTSTACVPVTETQQTCKYDSPPMINPGVIAGALAGAAGGGVALALGVSYAAGPAISLVTGGGTATAAVASGTDAVEAAVEEAIGLTEEGKATKDDLQKQAIDKVDASFFQ